MMKRFISAFLLLASLYSLSACGGDSAPSDAATESDKTSVDTEAATTSLADVYGITPADFGGEEFSLITGEHAEYEYKVEKESGDIVEDAVYLRNRAVEELLNIKFSFTSQPNWANNAPYYTTIRNDIMAGDCSYDIINGLNVYTTRLVFEDLFLSLDEIETINFDHPWWVTGLPLDGSDTVPFAFTDASLSLHKDLYVLFFNKSIIDENHLESPYELVNNGTWTVDAFMRIAREGTKDLNGDGVIDEEVDQIAYLAKHAANRSFMTSTQTSVFTTASDGTPTLEGLSERLVNVYESMKPFLNDRTLTFITTEPDMILLSKPFIDERAMFLSNCLIAVEGMRNMTDDYGFVPFPKYDESQDSYYTQIATSTSAIYLPVTSPDAERTGTVLEALGFYSWRDVVPTYYEMALGVKYARDTEVKQMIDLIRASATTNIDFAYGALFGTYDIINAAWEGKELASWYARTEKSVSKSLEKYLNS